MDSKSLLCIAGGISLGLLIPLGLLRLRRKCLDDRWKNHIDEDLIQVCVYSTEHLHTLGRVEKRTIYVNDLSSFFGGNELVLEKVKEAALRTTDEVPFVPVYLSHKDRWHIMNICLNRVSAMFGSFHVFFNEARRCQSYYRSAWYLMTLSFSQNTHRGRFFVTPYKPVLAGVDVGVKRLRLDLVNESEMREICASSIVPPDWGFFNNRHKHRWELLLKMSELFQNQLVIINGDVPVHPSSPGVRRGTSQDLALLNRLSFPQEDKSDSSEDESPWQNVPHNPRELARQASRVARQHGGDKEIDNCIVRVHIPYPASMVDPNPVETHSKDVVLFE